MANKHYLKKKGFTLIEILIVIAVISVIVLIGLSSYGIMRKKIRLDIATNSLQSIITEARDKTRAGYYEGEGQISEAKSVCFGVRITKGEFVELLGTPYDRLKLTEKCSRIEQDKYTLPVGEKDEDIVIKNIELFGSMQDDELELFFMPPLGDAEILEPGINRDPLLRIVIGYGDSEDSLDHREVVFNALTGNSYTQRFTEE